MDAIHCKNYLHFRTWHHALAKGHLHVVQYVSNTFRLHNYIKKSVRWGSFKSYCTTENLPHICCCFHTDFPYETPQIRTHGRHFSMHISHPFKSKTAHRNAGACGRTTLWHFLSLLVGKLKLHTACLE